MSPPLWFVVGLFDGQQLAPRPVVDRVAVHGVGVDAGVALGRQAVADVERPAVGRARDAEQALLDVGHHPVADVEHRLADGQVGHGHDPALAFGDVEGVGAGSGGERRGGVGRGHLGECQLDLVERRRPLLEEFGAARRRRGGGGRGEGGPLIVVASAGRHDQGGRAGQSSGSSHRQAR